MDILDPWVQGQGAALDATALATLWLRAMHHLGRLHEAWRWIQARGPAALDAAGAGVAALVALDHDQWAAAEALTSAALRRDAAQPEALIAKGSLLLGRRDMEGARRYFALVTEQHPHQARGWTMLGFACLLGGGSADARAHFGRALQLLPGDTGTRVALGWACLLGGDMDAALEAFRESAEIDPDSADAHGGIAVVLALRGQHDEAANHAHLARQLKPGHVAAGYADSIVGGNTDGLRGLHKLVSHLFGPDKEELAAPP